MFQRCFFIDTQIAVGTVHSKIWFGTLGFHFQPIY